MSRITLAEDHLERLFGTRDDNLRYLEERLAVSVSARGTEVVVHGDPVGEQIATRLLESFDRLLASVLQDRQQQNWQAVSNWAKEALAQGKLPKYI